MESPNLSTVERARAAAGSSNRLWMDARADAGRSSRASWPPPPDANDPAAPGYGGYQGAAPHGDQPHILDYVKIVYKRR